MKKKKIEDYLSPGFMRKKERIVLTIGREEITYRMLGKLIGQFSPQAAWRLNMVLESFKSKKPKNIRDLALKIDLNDLLDVGGVGEATVELWLSILNAKGLDPVKWLDSNTKILTECQKRRRPRRHF
ncbi:MAG: hypothetical protein WCK48_00280 [bacterium]